MSGLALREIATGVAAYLIIGCLVGGIALRRTDPFGREEEFVLVGLFWPLSLVLLAMMWAIFKIGGR